MAKKGLVSIGDRTIEEQRKICTAGGVASGIARRKRKELREAADIYLAQKAPPDIAKKLKARGIDAEEADIQMSIIWAMVEKALSGDTKAAALLFGLVDEREKVEVSIPKSAIDDVERFVHDVLNGVG